ncbi:hypothetical protein MUK42_06887 [Musa troglodytarum]|uniref:Uncharacterized protein n=1 Tax=Musa troglodytarum TaxID=320322 RepID=A0A9E7FUX2_9LILI|nr:hypothetical protein MUK42_02067 [Musa troglodytarum]URE02415.1 hypothetical protein MUK42_06887 [Musa troglodytarum]
MPWICRARKKKRRRLRRDALLEMLGNKAKMADGTNREENASDVAAAGRKTNNNNRRRKSLELQQAILDNMS